MRSLLPPDPKKYKDTGEGELPNRFQDRIVEAAIGI
jgi:hypothetical protein